LQLAKGGADISMTGDISDEALEQMAGSEAGAAAAKQVLAKAAELPDTLSDDQISFMMKNDRMPTADNLFAGVYGSGSGHIRGTEVTDESFEEMRPQIEDIIEKAGLEVSDEQLDRAKWLIKEDIPMTEENLIYLEKVKDASIENTPKEVLSRINDALLVGDSPKDATLISGFSKMDVARNVYEDFNSSDTKALIEKYEGSSLDTVKSARQVEEIRLMMSVEANISLIRKGMEIDTASLSELVDGLKELEQSLGSTLISLNEDNIDFSDGLTLEDKMNLFDETENKLKELYEMPAVLMGHFPDIKQVTVEKLYEEGKALSDTFAKVSERYDTMRTEVRRDLGDSMKKAFRNVNDILSDIGLEENEGNQRAVRILGYNQKEINRESVLNVKEADSAVQKLFKTMTPAVVTELIKRGENPLDIPLSKLQEDIDEIRGVGSAENDSEDFAKFLWKMEQNDAFTSEERESFIGMYRMMHQVVEADGAPIGALLYQGSEVTMRNLMTAIRSDKHSGREYTVDDETGLNNGFDRSVLSITEQIAMAFETRRMDDAKKIVTPEKLAAFDGEDNYLDLSPDQMATALEEMQNDERNDADEELKRKENAENIRILQEAVASEDKVLAAIRRFDLPGTAENLQMMQQMISDRNAMYQKLFGRGGERKTYDGLQDEINEAIEGGLESAFDDMMEDVVREFGEAVKTPEDMAKAQRKLEETAENVLRKALLTDGNVNSVRLRELKQSVMQLHTLNGFSRKEETYAVPIMVSDQMGNMSLKIVRGKEEEKGLVDIALDMPSVGAMRASLKADEKGASGEIRLERADTIERISQQLPLIASALEEALGGGEVTLSVKADKGIDANDVFTYTSDEAAGFEIDRSEPLQEHSSVQTRKLYGMARSLISLMADLM
ncbi:MAG: flagellar hook-length control protein FliK, partial [Lachnospiraceae bacterium]|nr:flagellar hook-length control protein FliK [Lachnospiraceae bacterium]